MKKLVFLITLIGYTGGLSGFPPNMYLAEIDNKSDDWYYFATTDLSGQELSNKLKSGAKAAESIAKNPKYSWKYYENDSSYYSDGCKVRVLPGNPSESPDNPPTCKGKGTFVIDKDWLHEFAFTDGRGNKRYETLILVPNPDPGFDDTCAPYIFIGPQDLGYRAQGYYIAKSVEGTSCCIDSQGNLCQNDSLMGWSEIRELKQPTSPVDPTTKLKLTIDPKNADPRKRILLEQIF